MLLRPGRPRVKNFDVHPLIDELRERRRARRWSQQELAAKIGKGWEAVRDWERGASQPRFIDIANYAAALNCELDLLEKRS